MSKDDEAHETPIVNGVNGVNWVNGVNGVNGVNSVNGVNGSTHDEHGNGEGKRKKVVVVGLGMVGIAFM